MRVSLNLAAAGKYHLDVKDIKGRVVESREFNAETGGSADVVLTYSPIPGVYIAEVLRGNASVARRKFVF